MREKIFISHATPADNEFTKWLALKLIGLGYDVWCDILELDKGVDFWKVIEKEIRENAIKFLVVLSKISNESEGVLKEIATASKVKKNLNDNSFIIPLTIDEELSFDDINIELVRLNAIDFKKSWATGLQDLIKALEKENVCKSSPNPERSNLLYEQIFLQNHTVIQKVENYVSNWFPIIEYPNELRFHLFGSKIPKGFDTRKLTFPAIPYKNYLCTFAYEYDFIHHLPLTETYDGKNTIRIETSKILNGEYDTEFISNFEAKRLIVQLTNKAFDIRLPQLDLNQYSLSNKLGFWFSKDKLPKNKYNKILLVGKQKLKNWHFGISSTTKIYPFNVLAISSHIFFTEDGSKIIESKSIQHSARRKQGKGWFNIDWKEKMIAFIQYLAEGEESFFLELGSEEKVYISTSPVAFVSDVSYNLPDSNALNEEVELSDMNNLDEIDIEDEIKTEINE